MSDGDLDIDDIVEQHKEETEGGRAGTEAAVEQSADDSLELEEAVREAYEQLDEGEIPENLTIRDEDLAALFAGLDETDGLEDVGKAAANALERDADRLDTRVAVLKLLVRVGLDEVAPDTVESAKEGRRQYLESQADEF